MLDVILNRYPHAIAISAVTKEGFDNLSMAVSDALSRSFLELNVQTDVANGKLMAFIAARGEILSKQFSETEVSIHCRMPVKFAGQIDRTQATVSVVSDGSQRPRQMTEEA
jgi:GTP-binding protein HflX